MANRSYLYAVDSEPTEHNRPTNIISLSEYSWDIPLAHKILAADSSKLCSSVIVDSPEKVSILGDAKNGLNNLEKLFKLIVSVNGSEEIKKELDQAINNLRNKIGSCPYILLETFEVIEVNTEPTEEEASKVLDECKASLSLLDSGDYSALNIPNNATLDELKNELGLFWDDVLYYDFGGIPKDTDDSTELNDYELKAVQYNAINKDYFYILIIFYQGLDHVRGSDSIWYSLRFDDRRSPESLMVYASKVSAGLSLNKVVKNDLIKDFHYPDNEKFFVIGVEKYDTVKDNQGNLLTRLAVKVELDTLYDVQKIHPLEMQLRWQEEFHAPAYLNLPKPS